MRGLSGTGSGDARLTAISARLSKIAFPLDLSILASTTSPPGIILMRSIQDSPGGRPAVLNSLSMATVILAT